MTRALVCLCLLCGLLGVARAAPLVTVYLAEGATEQAHASMQLAARVYEVAGEPLVGVPATSALQHWTAIRAGDEALVAIESVQFGAWRIRTLGYRLFAVSKRNVGYSVVTRPGITVLDVDDLSGLRIAVPAPPSLPALQLLALFPDPLRAPRLRHVSRLSDGLALLRAGRVDAAVLREPVSRTLGDVREVLTLEETPVAVVSVAPAAGEEMLRRLRENFGLDDEDHTASAGLPAVGRLRAPAEDDMARFARLLAGTWGTSR